MDSVLLMLGIIRYEILQCVGYYDCRTYGKSGDTNPCGTRVREFIWRAWKSLERTWNRHYGLNRGSDRVSEAVVY